MEKPQNQKKHSLTDPSSRSRDYGKYSSMLFQMGITIGLGVWGGVKLDQYFGLKKFPAFTLILSLSSIAVSFYFVIKSVTKK